MKKSLLAILVLAIVLGIILFWSKEAKAPIDKAVSDWKTYKNEIYGVELKVPPEYQNEPNSPSFKGDGKFFSVSSFPPGEDYCAAFHVCDFERKPSKTVIINGITWDYFADVIYCDVGSCGPKQDVYRTTQYNSRFYVLFENEQREKEILSNLKITGPNQAKG